MADKKIRKAVMQETPGGKRIKVGYLDLDPEFLGSAALNLAITPELRISPEKVEVDAWQIHMRHLTSTKLRSELYPYNEIEES